MANNLLGKGLIYKATSPSGKVYIGQTKRSLYERKRDHIYWAKKGLNTKFGNALRKYGSEIVWEVLHRVSINRLDELEIQEIKKYKSYRYGYNSTLGGDGGSPMLGKNHSKETIKKMSDAKKGKKFSEEHKRKMSEAGKRKVFSVSHRQKLREAALRQWEKQRNGQ